MAEQKFFEYPVALHHPTKMSFKVLSKEQEDATIAEDPAWRRPSYPPPPAPAEVAKIDKQNAERSFGALEYRVAQLETLVAGLEAKAKK